MQVLIALKQASGSVVSRDELIDRCWDGRIVGDDAVHRAVASLRKAIASLGEDAVTVETITRIGHRLVDSSRGDGSSQEHLDRRRILARGALAATLVAAGSGAVLWPRLRPKSTAEFLYEKGIEARSQMVPDAAMQSVAYFRQSVEHDPGFAPAWGALAIMFSWQLEFGSREEQRATEQRLLAAADRAQSLDPRDLDSLLAIERYKGTFGRWAEAKAAYETLYRRAPEHFLLPILIAQMNMEMGYPARAAALFEEVQAQRQQPVAVIGLNLSYAKWHSGDVAGAIREGERGILRWPDYSPVWGAHFHILTFGGQPARALDLLNGHIPMGTLEQHWIAMLEKAAIALVSNEEARRAEAISFARATLAADPMEYKIAPQVFAALGDPASALSAFERTFLDLNATNEGGRYINAVLRRRNTAGLFAPPIMPLWREPRMRKLAGAVGLPRAWAISGGPPRGVA
jgi:tetratricopeptide (TPR) repeat protein